jgi:hypothetical protein
VFTFTATPIQTITDSALMARNLTGAALWEITVFNAMGSPLRNKAQLAYVVETQHLTMAWNGKVTTATVENLPRGIDAFLND